MSSSFGLGMAGGNGINLGDRFSQEEFSKENAARLERERYARLLVEDGQLEYYAEEVRVAAEALQKASDEAWEVTYEPYKGFITSLEGVMYSFEAERLAREFRQRVIDTLIDTELHSLQWSKEVHDKYYAQNYGQELEI